MITCHKCGKTEDENTKNIDRQIFHLLVYGFYERQATCKDCGKILSSEGKTLCVSRHYHHVGDTCKVCGQKD